METSICIGNVGLTAVCGQLARNKLVIKSFAAEPLSEGALINGVVTDEALFSYALKQLMEKLPKGAGKGVRLAVNTSQIYVKREVVPALTRKRMLEYVKKEFVELDAADELLFDYAPLGPAPGGKGVSALLCACKKQLVTQYSALFSEAGIKLSCIDTVRTAQLKLVRFLAETRGKTFILLAMDGSSLDATLYAEGEFRMNNRVRLLSERGTEESLQEIARTVSSLVQFNRTERSGQEVSGVYLTGCPENEKGLATALAKSFSFAGAVLPDEPASVAAEAGFALADYAYAAGNLLRM